MTTWLTTDDVRDFNQYFVGPDMLRDLGLLESALLRPQATAFGEDAYPTLHEKAAALLYSLTRNHPFVDGNKRTAWAATAVFYQINGYIIFAEDGHIVGLVVDVAEGLLDVPFIASVLKDWTKPVPIPDEWIDTADDPVNPVS
jgi:death-on-curing protein